MTYNCYLAKKAKRDLYKMLLYKLDESIITRNELDIMRTLIENDEIQDILDHTTEVDREEE